MTLAQTTPDAVDAAIAATGSTNSNLSAHTVLVEFNVSMPRWSKKAADLAKEAASNHNAAERMHKHTERTLDADAFGDITAWEASTRAIHRKYSAPFSDKGPRMIAAKGIFAYKKLMDEAVDVGHALWADFLTRYDVAVQDARALRGDRFDINDYPTRAELEDDFSIKFRILAMPNIGNLPSALAGIVAQESQAAMDAAVADAKRWVFKQLRVPVAHMHEKLLGYTGGRNGSFHDTLVTKVSDVLDTLDSINIVGDPEIAAMGEAMRSALTTYSPDELRDNDDARADVAQAAQDILNVIDSFI